MNQNFCRSEARGNTLLFVLWMIAFIMLLVFSVSLKIGDQATRQSEDQGFLIATKLAEKGLVLGTHPQTSNDDPVLRQTFGQGTGFQVAKTKEAALINPNFLLTSAPFVFEELLKKWGAGNQQAQEAVQALQDWIDPDDESYDGGSESIKYARTGRVGYPYNRNFQTAKEMLLVDEFQQVARLNPEWDRYFTVLSEGPLDLKFAAKQAILLVTEANYKDVERFVEYRNGPDSLVGTEDDTPISTIDECLELLSLQPSTLYNYTNILSLGSSIERVVSVGFTDEIRVEIAFSFRYLGNSIKPLGKSKNLLSNAQQDKF